MARDWKAVGFEVPFPHLTHADNWPAYRMRMEAYANHLGLYAYLYPDIDTDLGSESHEMTEEEESFLVVFLLSTISDDIVACLDKLGCDGCSAASAIWQGIEGLMGDEEYEHGVFEPCKSRQQRPKSLLLTI